MLKSNYNLKGEPARSFTMSEFGGFSPKRIVINKPRAGEAGNFSAIAGISFLQYFSP
jgi:hypothetical protein